MSARICKNSDFEKKNEIRPFYIKPSVYNISRAEKERRLDLKASTGNVTQRTERKIIRTVSDNSQSSTRGLAPQRERDS